MKVSISSLKSMNRCGEQHRRQRAGEKGKQLSRTAFGSVMHHALHTLERHKDLELAINTFDKYWHPHNIDQICPPVDTWIGRDSYAGMRAKGIETLRRYADLLRYQDEEVLALEVEFKVDVVGTWDEELQEPHHLHGFVDRLSLRHKNRKLELCLDDWKTGKKPTYLRRHIQGTGYAYASTRPEFWLGNPAREVEGFGETRGQELFDRLQGAGRRFTWINVMGGPDFLDGGLRDDRDYIRLAHGVNTYAKQVQAGIFPLNTEGEVCEHCPFLEDCPEGINRKELV